MGFQDLLIGLKWGRVWGAK